VTAREQPGTLLRDVNVVPSMVSSSRVLVCLLLFPLYTEVSGRVDPSPASAR